MQRVNCNLYPRQKQIVLKLVRDVFWLGSASALPVLALDVQHGHLLLDMCGTPGGKSLLLARCLFGLTASMRYERVG